jgi:hypothetical protein
MAPTSTVSPIDPAGTPIFAALSQPVRRRSNCLPQHEDGMQAQPAAIDPYGCVASAPRLSVVGQLPPAHQQQVDRRREDDDSK